VRSWLAELRFRWLLATGSLRGSPDLVRTLYRVYLDHDKVIHVRDGHPVFSLVSPALFSGPAAHFLARTLYRTIQNRNVPNLMSFAVNDACNAACEHCSFFTAVDEPGRGVLTQAEAVQAIRDAQELGVSVINFVGGEPLMREDLPVLISAVDKALSTTLLFTNGWALEARAAELRWAGLDSVYASIDAADAGRHDAFRHRPGLFERALRGIEAARRLGCSTGFSTTMTPESWQVGELGRIVELAREVGVHEVFVFDAMPTGRYQARADIVDNPGWVDDMIRWARPYNRDPDYPAITFFAYIASHRSVGCACGTSYFYLSPYGDLMSCDFNHARFGNVREEPLWRIWERLSTRPEFGQSKWGGCKIKDSGFRTLDTVTAGRSPGLSGNGEGGG
jgi:MoaA/NifB/PqqE/SkfB family radical SAM enzyme